MPSVISVHKTPVSAYYSLFAMIVSLGLILLGAVGLLLVQKPLMEQTQDLRSQATVADGKVELSTTYTAHSGNGDHVLSINANTHNVNVERFELVFNIVTHTFSEAPKIILLPNTNLHLTKTEIEETSDGFLISVIAAPQYTGNSFVSNGSKGLIQLQFYPTREGTLTFDFDSEKSIAKAINSSVTGDQLRPIATATYTISRSTANSTFKQCNETCAGNSECMTGYRCFENRCRLATFPTDTACRVPADKGLQRTCNEYCADTRECASGFTCFFNRCRQPENPDSANCAVTTATQQQVVAKNCNQPCTSNATCAVNMRCFQGACRLATNPSSTSCSATTKKTVSSVHYPVVVGTAKGTPAAADRDPVSPSSGSGTTAGRPVSGVGTGTGSGAATRSGTATPSASPLILKTTPLPSPKASPVITPLPDTTTTDSSGLAWPMIALSGGIGILVLVVIISILNLLRRRGSKGAVVQQSTKNKAYEDELQTKINSLKQGGGSAAPPMPAAPASNPGVAAPVMPAAPVASPTPAPSTPPGAGRPPASTMAPTRPFSPPAPVMPTRPQPAYQQPAPVVRPVAQQVQPAQTSQTSSFTQTPRSNQSPQPLQRVQPSQPIQARPTAPAMTPAAATQSPAPTWTPPATPQPLNRPSSMIERLKQKGIQLPQDKTQ